MQIDREPCPGCESTQAFRPQWRYHKDRRFITIFIGCTVCPWEMDLEVSTVEIERLKKRLRRHQALARQQKEQFGAPSGQTLKAIDSLRTDIGHLKGKYIQGKIWT